MPCDWKNRFGDWIMQIMQPMCAAEQAYRASVLTSAPRLAGRQFNPVNTPPAWLARRNKLPAQRGGPRQ